jgi:hypothetical protein
VLRAYGAPGACRQPAPAAGAIRGLDFAGEGGADSRVSARDRREHAIARLGRGTVEEARTMAKGQKRSNKEIKKPKQVKPKAPAGQSTLSVKLDNAPDRGKGKK